jgi:hypothetical protein
MFDYMGRWWHLGKRIGTRIRGHPRQRKRGVDLASIPSFRSGLKPRLRRAFEGEAGSRRSGEGSSDLLGAAQEGLAGMADDLADGVEQQEA